jgi:hypothetical protein
LEEIALCLLTEAANYVHHALQANMRLPLAQLLLIACVPLAYLTVLPTSTLAVHVVEPTTAFAWTASAHASLASI